MHCGNDPELYLRYSMVITLIYVGFTYGLVLPLLYPIIGFSFFNLYVVERIKFAYFYKKPALFDNKLNDNVITALEGAPLLTIIFAIWQLGNRQTFFNEINLK